MTISKIRTGERGELLARSFLKKEGYTIIHTNYRTRFGEIDVIAEDKGYTCFIEIRSATVKDSVSLEHTVDRRKQNQISKVALSYIQFKELENKDCRFDVLCIKDVESDTPKFNLIKNAFELSLRYRY